jgi:hypothetical protein
MFSLGGIMTKKSLMQQGKRIQVVLDERQLSATSGGWIGGAGLGVAGQAPADGQTQIDSAMDGYVRG